MSAEDTTEAAERPLAGKSILVVDDEPIGKMYQAYLRKGGAQVTLVSSGEEALANIQAGNRYDLVITDLLMFSSTGPPAMNGDELVRRLKELRAKEGFEHLQRTTLAIMSSTAEFRTPSEADAKATALGADGGYSKHEVPASIVNFARNVLTRSRSNQPSH